MAKLNCWESKKCGRETECPAARGTGLDGMNSGRNGGRCCWAITGTLRDGQAQGSFAVKLAVCITCDFFKLIRSEEAGNYQDSKKILEKIKGK
ncbi:MAG: hypothetical protein PHF84_05000 [bacterium]|nr:hypothetical protein [bacterium]